MTAASPAALSISNVSKRFGAVNALSGVSLELGRGKIACLVGQSGCGKSTLLRTIAGVEDVDAGTISIEGRVVTGPETFVEPEDRTVGFMFQDYALFPHLTALQNIMFGLKGLGKAEAKARAGETVERLGIGALVDRHPHMLSGGEQQRVALARALAPQPHVLLMDEPFSNLDRRLRDTVRTETQALLRSLGTTAIIVTHDPEEALSLGDKVVLMHKGKVIEAGSGDALYSFPQTAYAAEFFSRVNRIPARRSGEWLDTPIGRFPAPCGSSGAVLVYVRPQSVALDDEGVSARVTGRILLGEIEEVSLTVQGLDDPLVMRTSARCGLDVGNTVQVKVNPQDIMVFAADESARSALPG